MVYISVDIETTGLDPETCQILSFGAIIEDTTKSLTFEEVPKFYRVVKHKQIIGEPYALNMNKGLIEEITKDGYELVSDLGLVAGFWQFLLQNGVQPNGSLIDLKIAGKNFGTFDKLFIERLPKWKEHFRIHQRILDPGNLYVDFQNDEWLPNLDTCLERAGVEKTVSHNALEDAWDVILTLRNTY